MAVSIRLGYIYYGGEIQNVVPYGTGAVASHNEKGL